MKSGGTNSETAGNIYKGNRLYKKKVIRKKNIFLGSEKEKMAE